MSGIAATFRWFSAVAAFAMMLGVQTLHSPLQHALESVSLSKEAVQPALVAGKIAGKVVTACGHTHHHGHGHHDHSHSHANHAHGQGDRPCSDHSHSHSDECQLCQFLHQALQPLSLIALVAGEERVSTTAVEILPELVLIPLVGPPVRGPPHLS